MKELKIKRQSGITKFITGKGFYLSAAISLILIGSTIWFVMNKSIDDVVDKNIKLMKNQISDQSLKSVDNIVKDVPINQKIEIAKLSEVETKEKIENNNEVSTESQNQNEEIEKNIEEVDNKDLFITPLVGKIINGFSNNELVKNTTLSDWRVHNGVDIEASQGTSVKAVADGEIIKISSDPMMGVCVEIEHSNNINSVYYGLNENVNVKEGDKVEVGTVIGSVGNTAIGETKLGPHLHLEMIENGIKIDPLSKIKMS